MDRGCAGCSSVMPDVARFCPRCGRRIDLPAAVAPGRRKSLLPRLMMAGTIALMLLSFVLHFVARSTITRPAMVWPHEAADARIDLADSPHALFNDEYSADRFTLHGVGLGDDPDLIPRRLLEGATSSGATRRFRCEDGNSFETFNRAVSRIVLEDPALLELLGLKSLQDVIAHFEAPEARSYSTSRAGRDVVYSYASRGITVRWDEAENRVDAIVLSRPSRPSKR